MVESGKNKTAPLEYYTSGRSADGTIALSVQSRNQKRTFYEVRKQKKYMPII